MHALRLSASFSAALIFLAPSARADVIVVPPPTDPNVNVIGAAIAQAQPGDTIQLLEGVYPILDVYDQLLIDKPLRLLGAGPGSTRVEFSNFLSFALGPNEVEVRGIAAGGEVLIQGLTLLAGAPEDQPGSIFVHDCEGVVSLLDCELTGQFNGGSILRVERCAAFHAQSVESTVQGTWGFTDAIALLEDCTVDGLDAPLVELFTNSGAPGVRADRSGLLVSGSTITGGRGGATGLASGVDAPGRAAIELQSSSLSLFGGSVAAGGNGGSFYGTGARGGPAVAADEFSRLRFDPSTLLVGGMGASGLFPAVLAEPGASVIEQDRLALHLSAPNAVIPTGSALSLIVAGEPGTPFGIYVAMAPLVPPVPLAGVSGLVGLDLRVAFELFEGFSLKLDAGGDNMIQSTFSTGPLSTSSEFSWQAVEFLPSGVASTSNALLTLIEPL